MIHVGVVAAGNGFAEARVLAYSIARYQPAWRLTVLVLPGLRPELRPDDEPFDVVMPGDFDVAWLGTMPTRSAAAVWRPLLAARLLDRGAERVLLLASDAQLYGPLETVERALEQHAAMIVPRLLGRLPADDRRPDGRDLLEAGEIDDGIVGFSGAHGGREVVAWWLDRMRDAAEARLGAERPDAVPLGIVERVFDGVVRVESNGCGVSFWNLHERPLERTAGLIHAGGAPLRLFRWSGFRPDRPWWLAADGTRVLVLDDLVLADLCRERAAALLAAGWLRLDPALAGGELPGGLRYDERLMRLEAEAAAAGETFGDVFSKAGADAFVGWLTSPSGSSGINRYALDVWQERDDLQSAYPDPGGSDAEGFRGWLWVHGRSELGLHALLLPPPPEWAVRARPVAPAVLVSGYLRGNLGLGQAARAYVAALEAAEIPVATRTFAIDPPVERAARGMRLRPEEQEFADRALPAEVAPEVDLVCVNADQTAELIASLRAQDQGAHARYTIGSWAWETDHIPERWDAAFALVDEIWVYSRYVAENLARASEVPVVVVPPVVGVPDPGDARAPSGIPDGAFAFLFAFDFFSTLQRKNPLGLVRAFARAFTPGEGPLLVLKTINANFRLEQREQLRAATGDRDDIVLLDVALPPAEMAALFRRADAYVSLHRAEGFGLTMAESMALGKPVIATGYSGNTDFMTPANAYLVDWRPTSVGHEAEHYPAEGTWAEPDLDHAAALMREVWEHQDAARARGERAASEVRATLSAEAVGAIARRRLLRIASRLRDAPAPELPGVPADVGHRLHFPLDGGEAPRGPRGLARRGLFRALRPYTSSQRALDEAVVETVARLDVDLSANAAAADRERVRAADVERRLTDLESRAETVEHLAAAADRRIAAEGRDWSVLDPPRARAELDGLVTAARAVPYTAGEPFQPFHHPVAGRVLGFRRDTAAEIDTPDAYRAFEDVFRGTRERVSELVHPYVELFTGRGPVLDVGCGRGELVEALGANDMEVRGIDLDEGMVADAAARGLDVSVADAFEYLSGMPDARLGAIVSMQVIEHLPRSRLAEFFRLCRSKLLPGGLFVAETVNPHAGHALKTFWVDLSHEHPVFPEVALALAADTGFADAFVTHLLGVRDFEVDRFNESSYALVATTSKPT